MTQGHEKDATRDPGDTTQAPGDASRAAGNAKQAPGDATRDRGIDASPEADARRFRHTGRLAIDFSLTGGEGEQLARFERLHAPTDLADWFAQSDLAVAGLEPTPRDLRTARRLRWAIWCAVQATVGGGPPSPADASTIDAAAARPPLVPSLATGGWLDPTPAQAMSNIARDAIALLTDPAQRSRLRVCAADDCPVPFYDGSRPGRRRWCEDWRCGDRHRHRRHRRGAGPGS